MHSCVAWNWRRPDVTTGRVNVTEWFTKVT
jgi:hypothetical protein